MHPHRGIETVTYVLAGVVRHQDTLGNAGSIGAGDVQWMTAGRGIMHEEMPEVRPEGIAGLQLWVNLPAKVKMTAPRYQDIRSADLPEVKTPGGATVRVIAGAVDGVAGPVTGIAADPVCLDVSMPPRSEWTRAIEVGHTAFAYVLAAAARFAASEVGGAARIADPTLVVWGDGDHVTVETADEPVRFVFVSGQPLAEPIARHGPFVMNTREEIEQALADLRQGTFV